MQNTIAFTLPSNNKQVSFKVNKKNLPFSNNFTLMGIKRFLRTRNGRDAVSVLVKCTTNSNEPGRIYICMFTQAGTLLACNTLN